MKPRRCPNEFGVHRTGPPPEVEGRGQPGAVSAEAARPVAAEPVHQPEGAEAELDARGVLVAGDGPILPNVSPAAR